MVWHVGEVGVGIKMPTLREAKPSTLRHTLWFPEHGWVQPWRHLSTARVVWVVSDATGPNSATSLVSHVIAPPVWLTENGLKIAKKTSKVSWTLLGSRNPSTCLSIHVCLGRGDGVWNQGVRKYYKESEPDLDCTRFHVLSKPLMVLYVPLALALAASALQCLCMSTLTKHWLIGPRDLLALRWTLNSWELLRGLLFTLSSELRIGSSLRDHSRLAPEFVYGMRQICQLLNLSRRHARASSLPSVLSLWPQLLPPKKNNFMAFISKQKSFSGYEKLTMPNTEIKWT